MEEEVGMVPGSRELAGAVGRAQARVRVAVRRAVEARDRETKGVDAMAVGPRAVEREEAGTAAAGTDRG